MSINNDMIAFDYNTYYKIYSKVQPNEKKYCLQRFYYSQIEKHIFLSIVSSSLTQLCLLPLLFRQLPSLSLQVSLPFSTLNFPTTSAYFFIRCDRNNFSAVCSMALTQVFPYLYHAVLGYPYLLLKKHKQEQGGQTGSFTSV